MDQIRARPAESQPVEPVDLAVAPTPLGRDTMRMLRRVRVRVRGKWTRVALIVLGVAVAAALACFAPPLRPQARAAVRHASTQMQIMFERVLPGRENRP
jgi:hypothetical protein